jgi:hypothetical protein
MSKAPTGNPLRATSPPPPRSPRRRGRRTMGLCAHCHRPIEIEQEHLRLYRMFWHVDCALAAHESADH